jgi:nucleotide-binding universal stress UspA family protein
MVPQIKKILYATDLTKNSSYAFYFAADLARKHDAKIIILHCIGTIPPSVYMEAGFTDAEQVMQRAKEQEKKEDIVEIKDGLTDFCRKVESQIGQPCASLVSDIIVKAAYPVEEILNIADEQNCDVIVLGTHGKGLLRQAFLGSVARSVLERTRIPLFVVPLPSEKTNVDWSAARGQKERHARKKEDRSPRRTGKTKSKARK